MFHTAPDFQEKAFFLIKENLDKFDDRATAIAIMDQMCLILTKNWVDKMVSQGKKEQVIAALVAMVNQRNQVKGSKIKTALEDILEDLNKPSFPWNVIVGVYDFFAGIYHKLANIFNRVVSYLRPEASSKVVFGDDTVKPTKYVEDEKVKPLSKDESITTTSEYIQTLSQNSIKHSLEEKYPLQKQDGYTTEEDDDDDDDTFNNIIITYPGDDSQGRKPGMN